MNIELIKAMHTKFGITAEDLDFTPREKEFRIAAMQEELDEYIAATEAVDELDALVDLIVFAAGTIERQGWMAALPEAFERVMTANCAKELGSNKKRGSFAIDLVKPEGWSAPVLTDLVEK